MVFTNIIKGLIFSFCFAHLFLGRWPRALFNLQKLWSININISLLSFPSCLPLPFRTLLSFVPRCVGDLFCDGSLCCPTCCEIHNCGELSVRYAWWLENENTTVRKAVYCLRHTPECMNIISYVQAGMSCRWRRLGIRIRLSQGQQQ